MNANLTVAGLILIPMIVVLVLSEQAVIRANIALQPWVICPGRVYHDAFGNYCFACFEAGIIRKY
jgi:hypothetical protein